MIKQYQSTSDIHQTDCGIKQPASRRQAVDIKHTHTHTHTFKGPFSGTTQVSQYQKGKTYLDFTEARDSEWRPTNSVKALMAFVDISKVCRKL